MIVYNAHTVAYAFFFYHHCTLVLHIMANLVHLEEDRVDGQTEPMDRVRKAVWGMLYADDAGVVSKSPEGLTKMMKVIVTVFEAAGLTVSEKKTEIMLFRTPHQEPQT